MWYLIASNGFRSLVSTHLVASCKSRRSLRNMNYKYTCTCFISIYFHLAKSQKPAIYCKNVSNSSGSQDSWIICFRGEKNSCLMHFESVEAIYRMWTCCLLICWMSVKEVWWLTMFVGWQLTRHYFLEALTKKHLSIHLFQVHSFETLWTPYFSKGL